MLTLLFYELSEGAPTPASDIEAQVEAIPGMEFAQPSGSPYRAGRWRDAQTGASCVVDLGPAPIEEDHLHPPTAYDSWRTIHMTVQIPLSGPHWLCVEVLQMVEGFLQAMPHLRALDTEDTSRGEETGPAIWNRPRVLASWERLHHSQSQGRTDLTRMNRLESVCLWRYRRERQRGQHEHPDLLWPEALVVFDTVTKSPRSAVFWRDPSLAMALPPVAFVIIQRGADGGILSLDTVLDAARMNGVQIAQASPLSSQSPSSPQPLSSGQAVLLTPSEALLTLHRDAPLLPTARFRALGDLDWTD